MSVATLNDLRAHVAVDYGELVAAVADDCELTPAEIAERLRMTGRSINDLDRHVELLKQRRQWSSDRTVLPAFNEKRAKLRTSRQTLARKLEPVFEEAEAMRQKAQDEIDAFDRKYASLASPRVGPVEHELRRTSSAPDSSVRGHLSRR